MNIVGIYSSTPGMGKTTVAKWLQRNRGFYIVSFASPIKAMARALLEGAGYTAEEINRYLRDPVWKDTKEIPGIGTTMRVLLQTIGTDWGRNINEDIWVNIAMQKAYTLDQNVVIDDMRFPNELRRIENERGITVRVVRDVPDYSNKHASENRLDNTPFDFVIENNGSLEELYAELEKLFPPWFFRN